MILEKEDIWEFFLDLAQWMSERHTHAQITVGGGSALVLQTQFRRCAADIDLHIDAAIEKAVPLGLAERTLLFNELAEEFPIVDIKYARIVTQEFLNARRNHVGKLVGPDTRLMDYDPDGRIFPLEIPTQKSLPYYHSVDAYGNGVTTRLVSLDDIFRTKIGRLQNTILLSNHDKQLTDVRDLTHLSDLLNRKWEEEVKASVLAQVARPGKQPIFTPYNTAEFG